MNISLLVEDKISTINIVDIVESSLEKSNNDNLTQEERLSNYKKMREKVISNPKK